MAGLHTPDAWLIGPSDRTRRENGQLGSGGAAGLVLALGGGFSRGFAHLGVLEVLQQEQIPISGIVGTSIGSLLGAAFADGIPVRELCDLGRHVNIRDFIRFRRADLEAQTRDRIGQFVRENLRSSRVEELSIPVAIVTTDIHTCAPYVFTRGPLDVAIRASCAFPGLFRPVEYEGRTLADGCIVAPVPTAVAAHLYAGCVLGVTVNSGIGKVSLASEVFTSSGRAFDVLQSGQNSPSWTKKADVVIEPDVQGIRWNDFTRVDEALAAGAEAMRRALPRVRELLAKRSQQLALARIPGHNASQMVS